MTTPVAQQEYDFMYSTLGGKPVHATLAMHWARLVELIYSAEHCYELATDPISQGKNFGSLGKIVEKELESSKPNGEP